MATNNPVTIEPTSIPPSATGPRMKPTKIGAATGIGTNYLLSKSLRPQTTAQGGQGLNYYDAGFVQPGNAKSFYTAEFR